MIELTAKIELKNQKDIAIEQIKCNIPDIHGKTLFTANDTDFSRWLYCGSRYCDNYGRFGNPIADSEVVSWVTADKETFFPKGRGEYNGIPCTVFSVAYVFDTDAVLPHANKVRFLDTKISFYSEGMYAVPEFVVTDTAGVERASGALDFYVSDEAAAKLGEVVNLFDILPTIEAKLQIERRNAIDGKYYVFDIETAEPTDYMEVEFTEKDNGSPLYIIADGVRFDTSSGVGGILKFPNYSKNHKLIVEAVNYISSVQPLKLFSIKASSPKQINISKRNILSLESSIFDRSEIDKPSWGVFSNSGRLEFADFDGRVENISSSGLLSTDTAKISVYIQNKLSKNGLIKIGDYQSAKWEYDNENKNASVSFNDNLVNWQNISIPAISYDPRSKESKKFSRLYEYLWEKTNPQYPMQSLDELDEKTKEVLENTFVGKFLLKEGNLWAQWDKLCVACQLHIYKGKSGKVVCQYNGGN